MSPKQLHRLAADYIPQLTEEGLLRRRTIELMDGRASLEEIAQKLMAEFPHRFSSWQQSLSYAGVVSQEYSRLANSGSDWPQVQTPEILLALLFEKHLVDFGRDGGHMAIARACRKLAKYAMRLSEQQHSKSIDSSEILL